MNLGTHIARLITLVISLPNKEAYCHGYFLLQSSFIFPSGECFFNILMSLFSTCVLYRDRQKTANCYNRWLGIFYMHYHIDMTTHGVAFDEPVSGWSKLVICSQSVMVKVKSTELVQTINLSSTDMCPSIALLPCPYTGSSLFYNVTMYCLL